MAGLDGWAMRQCSSQYGRSAICGAPQKWKSGVPRLADRPAASPLEVEAGPEVFGFADLLAMSILLRV
jgi:hypothetical protein